MIFSFNDDSLGRHNISHKEVFEALEDPFKIEAEVGEHQGNPTSIWIGKTFTERMLEIGVEYLEDCNHIYHTNKARKQYISKYSQGKYYND